MFKPISVVSTLVPRLFEFLICIKKTRDSGYQAKKKKKN